jgi:hypothetical protein
VTLRPPAAQQKSLPLILSECSSYEHLTNIWFWRVEVSASISVDDVVNRLIEHIGDCVGFAFPVHRHMSDFD